MSDERPVAENPEWKIPDENLEAVVVEYLKRLEAGEALNPKQILAAHPGFGSDIIEALREFVDFGSDDPPQPLGALGDYTLRRRIGRGGMGIVYDAWQNSMERRVALKVLPAGIAADERALQRFVREAKTAGQLNHQNVVGVYGLGVEANTPYYAMEYVEGETLAQILAGLRESRLDAPTPFGGNRDELAFYSNLARVFANAADGLQHAHAKGIIHRDIKPSNLILDCEGRLRILDFGLALLEGQESITASGDVVGTVQYMSPEQAQVRKIAVDHRTDIYSLGATMYEMLAMRPPFKGRDHRDTLSQIIERDPIEPRRLNPRLPRDLETIVLKCLRKEPRDRYGTAEALGQDLRRFVRGDPIEARSETQIERVLNWTRRRRTVLGTAVLLLGLVAVVAWLMIRRAESERLLDEIRRETLESRYHQLVSDAVLGLEGALGSQGTLVFPGVGFVEMAASASARSYEAFVTVRAALEHVLPGLEEAQRLLPDRADASYHRARALLSSGDTAGAAATLDRLLRKNPDFPPALILRRAMLAKPAREGGGASNETEAVAAEPRGGDWKALMLIAQEAIGGRAWEKAAETYGALIRGLDTAPEPYIGASLEFWMGRGKAHLAAKQWNAALVDFAGAAALWPRAPGPRVLLANTYYFMRDGRAEADRVLLDLWTQSPVPDEIAAGVFSFYLGLRDPKRAEPWVKRLAQDDRTSLLRAKLLDKLGDTAGALALCERLLATDSRNVEAIMVKIETLLHAGDHDGAAETARAALSCLPGRGEVWVLLGWSEFYRCRLAESVNAFERGLGALGSAEDRASFLAIERSYALNGLGWVVRRMGPLDRAKECYELALESNPDNAGAWFGLGGLHREWGNTAEAVRCHAESLVRNPASSEAFRFLLMGYDAATAARYQPYWRSMGFAARDALDRGEEDAHLYALAALERMNDPTSGDAVNALSQARQAAAADGDPLIRGILSEALWAANERVEAVRILEQLLDAGTATRLHTQLLQEYRRTLLPQLASLASADWFLDLPPDGHGVTVDDLAVRHDTDDGFRSAHMREYLNGCVHQREGALVEAARIFGTLLDSGALDGEDLARAILRRSACLFGIGQADAADREIAAALATRNDLRDVRLLWNEWLRFQWTVLAKDTRAVLQSLPSAACDGYALDVRWLLEELAAGRSLRINCGGQAYNDCQSRTWGPDRFFLGGISHTVFRPEIAGTEDDSLYGFQRGFPPDAARAGYAIPLPPGSYRVTIHFCEIYYDDSTSSDGRPRRQFEVYIEGSRVDGYDPVGYGYCTAHSKAAEAVVDDGILDIAVAPRRLLAPLCAIEVSRIR